MTGTLINAATILIGGTIGLLIHARLSEKTTETVFSGIALFTLFLGIHMATQTGHFLVLILSLVLGSITGEGLGLENGLNRLSESLKKRIHFSNARFSEGLLTSFLLFCIGSMTILGAIEEGIGNKPNLLMAKAVMDGFSSIALAAGMGIGVLFSVVPLLIVQGGITLLAGLLQDYIQQVYINEITASGGILLIGLGINLLGLKKIRILNMVPAILFSMLLTWLFLYFDWYH